VHAVEPGLDGVSRAELASRWAYRAELEQLAAARFERLAGQMAATGCDAELVAIAREAAVQERTHVRLCGELAERFGGRVARVAGEPAEIAPAGLAPRDRVIYEVVAFCCVTETANAAVVTAGADDIDDAAVRRAIRTILADEVQHSRLGWRFLATHELADAQRAWLGGYLPHMLRGTVRDELFGDPPTVVGDERAMERYGTLPVAGRRRAFLDGMREVLLPGLALHGIDIAPGAAFLDELEARSSAHGSA
jgi:hypothetical protein